MYDNSQYCTAVGISMNKSFSQGLDTKIINGVSEMLSHGLHAASLRLALIWFNCK